jgi:C-terminal processing protease CtpA/Prc
MLPISSLPDAHGVSRGEEGVRPLEQHVGRWLVRGILCSAFTMILLACGHGPRPSGEHQGARIPVAEPQIRGLYAFARLYGVLRWFHPSDAAATIDWDRFAVEGVRRTLDVTDPDRIRIELLDLLAPIAPTVHIATEQEALPPFVATPPRSQFELVAWEHLGYGDSILNAVYASKRRHRARIVAVPGVGRATLSQSIAAAPYRGARFRLRGQLRAAHHGLAQLWLRIDRGNATVFFDDMFDRPVSATTWRLGEITGTVDSSATLITFGTMATSGGSAGFDDLDLAVEVNGKWTSIPIQDPGFESRDVFASWTAGTGAPDSSIKGWDVTLDTERPATGSVALRMQRTVEVVTAELFADSPAPGETVDVDLGSGLRARVPIALYSSDGHTIGDDPAQAEKLAATGDRANPSGFDRIATIADVVVLWNVLEHFWPYWDTVSVDWNAALDQALADALRDRSANEHLATLRRLSVIAADGHATTNCPGASPRANAPFIVDVIEGQVVVTATTDEAVKLGDVIISVDGRPATTVLADSEATISGSPQWRLDFARHRFATGPPGSSLSLRIRRHGSEHDAVVVRGKSTQQEFPHPPIERLPDGVYYISLDRARMEDIKAIIDKLAAAPGIVFDLRDYPNSNDEILSYLITSRAYFNGGMSVPHVIRPDHTRDSVSGWDAAHDQIPALQPHIHGRVAFVTGPGAISYAETVLSVVERYHLGAIVGSATAGTNGSMAGIWEPSGCHTNFTGLRVTKPDGSRFHLVGIKPTIPATPTLAGVLAGRDEVLEKALAYVRQREQ